MSEWREIATEPPPEYTVFVGGHFIGDELDSVDLYVWDGEWVTNQISANSYPPENVGLTHWVIPQPPGSES